MSTLPHRPGTIHRNARSPRRQAFGDRPTRTRRRAITVVAVLVSLLAGLVIAAARPADAAPSPSPTPTSAVATGPAPVTVPASPPGVGLGSGAPTVPAPSVAPGTGSIDGGGTYNPGLFDITGHIRKAINDWFAGLAKAAFTPILDLLARSLLTTPQLTGEPALHRLWLINLGIADSLLVLLILAGGAAVMGYETLQTRLAAKQLAPRVVVAAITANVSLPLIGQAISLADALARTVLDGASSADAVGAMSKLILGSIAGNIFLTLLAIVVAVLAAMLLASWLLRLVLVVLLVVAAPLALVCHALPVTEGLAKLWWRAIAGTLTVQVAQSLVLVTALRVFLPGGSLAQLGLGAGGGLVNLLVAGCLLWVMVRIPTWTSRMVFTSRSSSGSVSRTAKQVLVHRAMRTLAGAAV